MPAVTDPNILAQLNGGGAAPAQAGGPVYGPPAIPDQPSAIELENLQLRRNADQRAQVRLQQDLQPGGGSSEPVPVSSADKAEGRIANYTAIEQAGSTFQDDFGGNPIGGLENTAEQYVGIGTPGQAQWWADFRRLDNQIRNELFGSALSAQEKAAYSATTIEPGMRPDIIRQNLAQRADIMRTALQRQRDFMIANGYNPQAVDTLFAPIIQQQDTLLNETGEQILGAGNDSDQTRQEIATQDARREDNPALAGVRAEYARRLARGDDTQSLIQWVRSAGVDDPLAYQSIAEQVRFRDENPDVAISEYDTAQLDDRVVPVSGFEQAAGRAGMSPAGTYAVSAADALTGFNLDSLSGLAGGNAERTRLAQQVMSNENPVSSMVGTLSGGTLASLAGEAAIGGRIASAGMRALAADAGYGAVAGAGLTDYGEVGTPATAWDRMQGAGAGTLAGLVGSYAGQKIGNTAQAFARGVGNPDVRAVQSANVPLTVGQQFGNSGRVGAAIKGAEDRLSGIPVLGDIVNARRSEGYRAFNSSAFNSALEPIGGNVGDLVAEEAVGSAQQQVSDAFETALAGKVAVADQAFGTDLTNAVTRTMALPRVGEEVADGIGAILEPYMRGNSIDGRSMQQISRELRDLRRSYNSDPLKSRIGRSIEAVEDAVFGLFQRQVPEVVPAYERARSAARRVYILEDAVNRAKNREGVFTTGQLGQADVASTKRYEGASAAASGKSPFHDFQRSMQNVLPNEVPDSGTAGRLILPAAAASMVGADAGLTDDGLNGGTLTLATILAGAYTKAGQRLMTKPGRGSRKLQAVTGPVSRRAIQAGTGASAVALTNQP